MPSPSLEPPQRALKRAHGDGSGLSMMNYSEGATTIAAPASTSATQDASRVKLPRLDRTGDFSSVVKNKLQSYTRTGQACDRCKVRKIRCDALPEGCSHCRSQNLDCYVTDRVTGRTERRGYLQELEREKTAMAHHIQQLESLLLDRGGIEVLPWQWSPYAPVYPSDIVLDAKGNIVQDREAKSQWACLGSVWYRRIDSGIPARGEGHTSSTMPSEGHPSDDFSDLFSSSYSTALQSCPVDNYLGVFADRAPLNSVNGTQVSILGTLLDIDAAGAGVEPEASSIYREPTGLYNRSLGSFLRSTMNINPPLDNVELPSRSDAFEYSEWYFLMVNPFAPVLHKPTYMTLLTRIYDDTKFQPTTAELVVVHMVFAAIYFQYGVRNREELGRQIHLHDLSNKHYHWALNKVYHLATDWSLTAVQAAVQIALYTRAFPKPGCGSTVANFALMKAIDLSLHRRAAGSNVPPGRVTTLANEMRKRVWWCALMLSITLNGRLGRPMPIGLADFDTEIPIAIADEYLTEDGITDPSKIGVQCPYLVGIQAMKFTPLYMAMFSGLYGARRDPRRYAGLVRDLERQYDALQASLSPELDVATCPPHAQMYALYAEAMAQEFRLCLRHPSVCMTADPEVFAENTRICDAAARALLRAVQRLLALKSLDTTWYQMSVYCAAMFSTLAAAWECRFEATPQEFARLQDETSVWLSVIAEISLLTGASDDGQPFNRRLTQICARTLLCIQQDMPQPGQPPRARTMSRTTNSGNTNGNGGVVRTESIKSRSSANGAGNGSNGGGEDGGGGSGNVDSVARHLEAQARLKLEGRLDAGQMPPAASAPHDPNAQALPLQHADIVAASAATSALAPPPVSAQQADSSGYIHIPLPPAYTSISMANGTAAHGYDHSGGGTAILPSHHQQPSLVSYTDPTAATHAGGGDNTTENGVPGAADAAAAAINPWTNWAAAVAEEGTAHTNDRFMSADALLDLSVLQQRLVAGVAVSRNNALADLSHNGGGGGGGGRGSGHMAAVVVAAAAAAQAAASNVGGSQIAAVGHAAVGQMPPPLGAAAVGGPQSATAAATVNVGLQHEAQWPLLLFNDHVGV